MSEPDMSFPPPRRRFFHGTITLPESPQGKGKQPSANGDDATKVAVDAVESMTARARFAIPYSVFTVVQTKAMIDDDVASSSMDRLAKAYLLIQGVKCFNKAGGTSHNCGRALFLRGLWFGADASDSAMEEVAKARAEARNVAVPEFQTVELPVNPVSAAIIKRTAVVSKKWVKLWSLPVGGPFTQSQQPHVPTDGAVVLFANVPDVSSHYGDHSSYYYPAAVFTDESALDSVAAGLPDLVTYNESWQRELHVSQITYASVKPTNCMLRTLVPL